MLFSSVTFLYYFLPIVLILYHIVPKKHRNKALLLVSLVFYAWGEPRYVFLMMGMVVLNYIAGIFMGRAVHVKQKKYLLLAATAVNVGVLCYYKFFAAAWPIGISFYIFQLLSYVVDVYRGNAKPQKNLINLGTYVTMFPQLIAGPIVRYVDIEKQLKTRSCDWEKILAGIERFVIGLGKKILISNALGELCEIFKASEEKTVLFFWIYAISYTLQIYFDFSGYSDMAIGLGKLFGFEFLENFNYPYISKSITEFWRRWHMSLGSWFRDYVYIPLGGNRVSKGRWYFNIFVVWSLTGLWHGAAWNFLLWGLFYAVLLFLEKQWLLKKLEKAKVWSHLYVMLMVIVGFVLFDSANLQEAIYYIQCMLGLGDVPFISAESVYYMRSYGMLIFVAVFGSTPAMKLLICKVDETACGKKSLLIFKPIGLIAIFLVCTAYLIDSSFDPFLYFRF